MSVVDGIKRNARTAKLVGILLVVAGFLALFAPHLTEDAMRTALGLRGKTNLDPMFADTELPEY